MHPLGTIFRCLCFFIIASTASCVVIDHQNALTLPASASSSHSDDPNHENTTASTPAQFQMAGYVAAYHFWLRIPTCGVMCEGDAFGLVANFGGTACWGNVNFDCAAIKGRTREDGVDIGFVTFGIVTKLPNIPKISPIAEFASGCAVPGLGELFGHCDWKPL